MSRILIIENDEWLKDCYSLWLNQHKIKWARDAQEALDVLDSHKIDLITLEMFLPFANGMQILNTLASHADFFKIPIIVLSIDPPKIDLLKNYGVKYVFNKTTVTQTQLVKAVNELL